MPIITRHAFGLDISDASLEALEIKKQRSKLTVSAYSRLEFEAGLVENGRVLNKEKLASAINQLITGAQPHALRNKNVALSIPESQTFIHVFQLPAVISEEHLGESVQYAAEETIPLSFDQVYHDYKIISRGEKYQEVLYVAAYKETVDNLREVLLGVGLRPVVFEPESVSLARALATEDMFEGVLIADLGARTTIITIYDHQGVRYSKNVPLAGNHLTEAVARALKIPLPQAEEIKRQIGLTPPQPPAGKSFSLEPLVRTIGQEIKKAITYHQQRTSFVINRVVLCGGTSLLPGLVEYLHTQLKIRVELGNPLAGVHYNQRVFTEQQAVLFSTVVGLALRGSGGDVERADINLLRHEEEHKKFTAIKKSAVPEVEREAAASLKTPRNRRVLVLAGVFFALLVMLVGFYLWRKDKSEPLISFVNTNYQSQVPEDTAAVTVEVELLIYTKNQESAPAGAMAGRLLEEAVQKNKEFMTTGKRTADKVATGRITIVNNYSAAQSLVATTRFLTDGGVLFRLKDAATVPANGQVEAEIYADQAGRSGEVAAGRLNIPGLSESLQPYIYGELKEPTTGGVREVSYVLETDIQKATEDVKTESTTVEVSLLQDMLTGGEIAVPAMLAVTTGQPTFSAGIGQEADKFSATWEVKATALAVPQAQVQQKLNEQLAEMLPASQGVEAYQLGQQNYTIEEFKAEEGTVSIKVTSRATLL